MRAAGIAWLIILTTVNVLAQQTSFRFYMGSGEVPKDYLQVGPGSVFSEQAGYGIDMGSTVRIIERGGKDLTKRSFMTADKPFFFFGECDGGKLQGYAHHW